MQSHLNQNKCSVNVAHLTCQQDAMFICAWRIFKYSVGSADLEFTDLRKMGDKEKNKKIK